jgi:PhnB protein
MSSHHASAAPPGYGPVTPWIISRDTARLTEFTKDASGARELGRVPGPDGRIGHAEVQIAGSVVMMFDAWDGWPDTRPSSACMWPTPMTPASAPSPPGRSRSLR